MKRAISIVVILSFVSVAGFSQTPTRRQQLLEKPNKAVNAIAIFDLSGGDAKNLNTALFFPFPSDEVRKLVEQACKKPVETFVELRKQAGATDRWIGTQGSAVDVYVVYDTSTDKPTIDIKEDPRETRLSTDFGTLVKIVKTVAEFKAALAAEPPGFNCLTEGYTLTRTRATLKISVKHSIGGEDTTVDKTITTGPTEHLFLSADVPVTKLKALKYDDSTNTVTTKDTPTAFYAGFDYTLGDIATTDPQRGWEGIVFKGMLKVSKKPLDGYGGAIGYRSPKFGILGMTFEAFTPFVGYFWTKYDDKDSAGKPITRSKNGIRFGISFSLDKALEWTKSGS